MELKMLETLYKNAKVLLTGIQDAGTHEEVTHLSECLENSLSALHDMAVHIITKGGN